MKVAVIGATGNIGSKIVIELLTRGHDVSGITRHPEQLQPNVKFTARRGDVNYEAGLAELLTGHDAVVSAVKFQTMDPNILIRAVERAAVKRLLVVGGAGSLDVAPGVQLVDTPDFPKAWKGEALAGREFLNILRASANWIGRFYRLRPCLRRENEPENSVSAQTSCSSTKRARVRFQ